MNRLLCAVLWVVISSMAVACEESSSDVDTDDDKSPSERDDDNDDDDDDDDDSSGNVDSAKRDAGKNAGKDAGKADASKADTGTGAGDDDDDDDDDGTASDDGYGATPLCSGEPEDECQACGCDMCAAEQASCNDIEGVAAEGPKAGTSKAELCRAVVDCGRKLGCRGQACITTPCAEQIFAAGELVNDIQASLPTLIERSMDPTYAVTLASKVSDCTVKNCMEACK